MTVDELQVLITANTNELRKEINKANQTISGLKKSANKGAGGVSTAFKKLKTGIVALGIGKVIKDSIQSGMDAIESDSLFTTVMGENAEAVKSWSNEVSNALGLSAVNMQKNIGVIYNMTSSMGVAGDNALKMSKGVSVLAEDMASFYNLDSAEAFNKLRAGLTGETEPLKALGILVDENTVKQVAYSEGIAENGAELTQQQKVLARYVAILKQTGNAQGDLARTLNSPSNQLRSLKQNVQNLGIAFSNFLMPVLQAVLPWLNALAKVATNALNSLAGLLGFTGDSGTSKETEKISGNVGGIGGGLDDATKKAKKLKNSLAGFDEMNVLQDNKTDDTATSSGGGSTGADIGFNLDEYDAHLDWIEGGTSELVKKIEGWFSSIGEGINFEKLTSAFDNLKKSVEPLAKNIWDGLKWAYDNVLQPLAQWTINEVIPEFMNILGGAIDIVNQAIEDVKPIFTWFWDNVLSPLAEWTGGVISTVLSAIGDALKWIADNETAMAIIEGVALAIGLVSAALGIYNTITTVAAVVSNALSVGLAAINWPLVLITAAIAAVIAIVILLVNNWDKVKEVAANVWNKIKEIWGVVATWINDKVVTPIKNFFSGLWTGIKNIFSSIGTWFSNVFTNAWTGIKNAWSTVKTWFSNIWTGIKNVFSSVGTWFKNIFTNAWTGIKNAWSAVKTWFSNLWTGIKNIFTSVGTWFKNLFANAWTGIKNAWGSVKTWFSNIWTGIKNVFNSVGSWFKGIFDRAWTGIKNAFSGVTSFFSGIWSKITGVFSNVGSAIAGAISGAVKKAINTVLSTAVGIINGFIKAINFAIGIINKIPGVEISKLNLLEVPKLARGGIIDKPTVAMVGEAGKEAVMPLERNTGWIDQLANKLGDKLGGAGGNIKLIVKLGEEAIFDRFIEYGKEKAFETNGEVVFV